MYPRFLALGGILALSASTALADDVHEDDRLHLRPPHHRRAVLIAPEKLTRLRYFLSGVLKPGPDKSLYLASPLSPSTRRALAAARGVPLAEIPSEVQRRVAIDPNGPNEDQVRRAMGQPVRALLALDRSGAIFLIDFERAR